MNISRFFIDRPRFAAVLRQLNLDVERLTLPDGGRSR